MIGVHNTPQLRVEFNGALLNHEHMQYLQEIRVQQLLNCPSLCELAFCDSPLLQDRASNFLPGNEFKVTIDQQTVFSGQVTACNFEYSASRQQIVRIRGYDQLHQLRKRKSINAHSEFRISHLLKTLASELGVNVEVVRDGPEYEQAVQYGQSDLAFLQELACQNGLYFVLREEIIYLINLQGFGNDVPLKLGETLLHVNAELNTDSICRSVEASGWDPRIVSNLTSSVNETSSPQHNSIRINPEKLGSNGVHYIVDTPVQNEQQLNAWAQAKMDDYSAREVSISGIAEGNPELQPGAPLDIDGLASWFNGKYVLTEATHIINSQQGYITEISTIPPRLNSHVKSSITTMGRVTNIDDPEKLGRVRVELVNFEQVETLWCQVLIPAAGAKKGLIALPNVDDLVLVVLLDGNAAEAVVLGGLFGENALDDDCVEGGERKSIILTTPNGQRITLNDHNDTLTIENNAGTTLEMSPNETRLRSATKLILEARGKSVEIIGASIDLNHG